MDSPYQPASSRLERGLLSKITLTFLKSYKAMKTSIISFFTAFVLACECSDHVDGGSQVHHTTLTKSLQGLAELFIIFNNIIVVLL
jgi:hypothetical protein